MANSLNALPRESAAPETPPQDPSPKEKSPSRERLNTILDTRLEETPGGPEIKQLREIATGVSRAIPVIDETISAIEELEETEYGAEIEDALSESLEEDSETPEAIEPMGIFALFILLGPAIILDLIDIVDLVLELAGIATAGTASVVWAIISLVLDIIGSIGMGIAIWIVGDAYLKSNVQELKKLGKTLLWAIRIGIVIFGIGDDIPAIEALPLECLSVLALYIASHFLSREEINARAGELTEKLQKIGGKYATQHNTEHPEGTVSMGPNNQTGAKRMARRESATSALNRFSGSVHT